MNARQLREEISREASRLARLQALAELAAVGAASTDRGTNGAAVAVRSAFEGLAELAHASWCRLADLSEAPTARGTPTRPRKRKPSLRVVAKPEAA